MSDVRVALVGVGGWGKNHARVLHEAGALCAICDTDVALAKEYGSRYDVPHHTSLDDLLASVRFEAAIVATPVMTHAAVGRKLLDAKKHVLLEKPFTYDPREGRELAAMARRAGMVLTCGYIERFNPAVKTVKGMVSRHMYGKLVLLEFHRENRIPPHIKDVGIIYDTAVHDIDTANWLFGEMPQVVYARSGQVLHEREDFATIILGYSDNRTAVIACNWISPGRFRTFRAAFADAVVTGDFIRGDVRVNGEPVSVGAAEPLASEIDAFLAAAAGERYDIVTPHEAISVTETAKAALLSGRQGVRCTWTFDEALPSGTVGLSHRQTPSPGIVWGRGGRPHRRWCIILR